MQPSLEDITWDASWLGQRGFLFWWWWWLLFIFPPCKSEYAVSIQLFSGVYQRCVDSKWSEDGKERIAVYDVT